MADRLMNRKLKSQVAWFFLAVFAFGFHAIAIGADLSYRVAGIIETDKNALAMIESSDGEQAVYRPGDKIGSGEIGSVSGDGVIVLLDGQTFLLPLQGEPSLLRDLELAKAGYHMKIGDGVGQYDIDFDEARAALMDANRPPDDKEKNNPDYIYQRIVDALNLPAGARVRAVGEKDIATANRVVLALVAGMQHDHLRIRVSGVPGVSRVYISGQPDLIAEQ